MSSKLSDETPKILSAYNGAGVTLAQKPALRF